MPLDVLALAATFAVGVPVALAASRWLPGYRSMPEPDPPRPLPREVPYDPDLAEIGAMRPEAHETIVGWRNTDQLLEAGWEPIHELGHGNVPVDWICPYETEVDMLEASLAVARAEGDVPRAADIASRLNRYPRVKPDPVIETRTIWRPTDIYPQALRAPAPPDPMKVERR